MRKASTHNTNVISTNEQKLTKIETYSRNVSLLLLKMCIFMLPVSYIDFFFCFGFCSACKKRRKKNGTTKRKVWINFSLLLLTFYSNHSFGAFFIAIRYCFSFQFFSLSLFFHIQCSGSFVWIFHDFAFANMSPAMYQNTIIILYRDQLYVITSVRWDYEKLKRSENNWIMIVTIVFLCSNGQLFFCLV